MRERINTSTDRAFNTNSKPPLYKTDRDPVRPDRSQKTSRDKRYKNLMEQLQRNKKLKLGQQEQKKIDLKVQLHKTDRRCMSVAVNNMIFQKDKENCINNQNSKEAYRLSLAQSRIKELDAMLARERQEKKLILVELQHANRTRQKQDQIIHELTLKLSQPQLIQIKSKDCGHLDRIAQLQKRVKVLAFCQNCQVKQSTVKALKSDISRAVQGLKRISPILELDEVSIQYQYLLDLKKNKNLQLQNRQLREAIQSLSGLVYKRWANRYNRQCQLQ